uniref:Cytochrome c oxidase subunit VIIc n=1 Tax=Tetradesmus obliquus TaxID=3088 RepID=A0A383VVA4_TETOB|eukprot:jgi/Sobl393_1/11390/SZX68356.1
MSAALRQVAREVQREAPKLARSIRTSTAPRYHYDYEHGPNYLNFQDWPGRRWKVAAWIGGIMTTGVGIPLFAVWWQQSKLSG